MMPRKCLQIIKYQLHTKPVDVNKINRHFQEGLEDLHVYVKFINAWTHPYND